MNINWRLKSFVFRVIDWFDAGWLLAFLQKHLTGNSLNKSFTFNSTWELHKEVLDKLSGPITIFEFGAGQSLIQNLYLYDPDRSQILYDINPLLDFNLVNNSINYLNKSGYLEKYISISSIDDLELYNISYNAPADARRVDLSNGAIDVVLSTDTFEHVPKKELITILQEMRRILKPGGMLSVKIEYSDHYSHTDKNISDVNFLKFSEKEWERYNHKHHFQNRLRHGDYKVLLIEAGFEIVSEKILNISTLKRSQMFQLSECEKNYYATSGYFLCSR